MSHMVPVMDPRDAAKVVDLAAFRRARDARQIQETAKLVPLASMSGGASYHEAAIREEDHTRRH